jgi:hypothetical protein
MSELQHNPNQDINKPLSERLRRAGALTGMIAALGGGLATSAKAESFSASHPQEAAKAQVSPEAKPKKTNLEAAYASVKKAIEMANNSKDRNIFYGAVAIPVNFSAKTKKVSVHSSVEPYINGVDPTLTAPGFHTVILEDPVCEVVNGHKVFIGTDRGSIEAPTPDSWMIKDASTERKDITKLKTTFVFYDDAVANNHELVYYAHNGSKPKMAHSTVREGMRYIGDGLPQLNPTGNLLWGYGITDLGKSPLDMDNYMSHKGFYRATEPFAPTFDK